MKLSEKIRLNKCDNLINRIRSMYFDYGICPECGSERVKETGFCESDGASSYKCVGCGHRGWGLAVDDKQPTEREIAEYEDRILTEVPQQ